MLKGYKGDAVVAAGEAFDPAPANIDKRTTRATLPGGLKLSLLPKKTRGATVVADLTLRFGDEKSLMNRSTAGQLAGAMLMRGTTKRTRQQIQDEFDRLKARVRVGGAATNVNASIETNRENLPAVLRLVNEVLREPSFPAEEFELAPPAAAGQPRRAAERSDRARIGRVPAPHVAAGKRGCPLREDHRRIDRRSEGRDARRCEEIPR